MVCHEPLPTTTSQCLRRCNSALSETKNAQLCSRLHPWHGFLACEGDPGLYSCGNSQPTTLLWALSANTRPCVFLLDKWMGAEATESFCNSLSFWELKVSWLLVWCWDGDGEWVGRAGSRTGVLKRSHFMTTLRGHTEALRDCQLVGKRRASTSFLLLWKGAMKKEIGHWCWGGKRERETDLCRSFKKRVDIWVTRPS